MHLVVGLGNPGTKYTYTRHNVGFLCVEHALVLLEEAGAQLSEKSEHQAMTWRARVGTEDVIFAEPQTFMNLSGRSVQPLMAFYKIPLENILVVQDDLDLPFGRLKFLKNRGAGGHNGIKNITELLGTPDYARLKIGVGGPRHPGQAGADYVLENFPEAEVRALNEVFDKCFEAIKSFVEKGYDRTANVYNQRTEEPSDGGASGAKGDS
jgi:PTH1 family peptidyl-tRNA hydrolase